MALNTRLLAKTDIGKLELFLKHSGTHHYQLDPLFRWEGVDEYVANVIHDFSCKEPVFVAVENDSIKGLIGFRKRGWDTDHFGYPVASIDYFFVEKDGGGSAASLLMSKFNEWAQENKIKFISIKTFPDHNVVKAIEESGFYYVGADFILSKPLPDRGLDGPPDPHIRLFHKNDLNELLKIARNAPWINRFHSDPNIDKEKASKLYVNWLDNGIKKDNARVTILDVGGKPAGFILWSVTYLSRGGNQAVVGDQELVALDPAIRGRGYGKILYRGALAQMQEAGVNLVETGIAANNAPALNNQAKLGFYFNYSVAVFHKFVS